MGTLLIVINNTQRLYYVQSSIRLSRLGMCTGSHYPFVWNVPHPENEALNSSELVSFMEQTHKINVEHADLVKNKLILM